MTNYLNHKLIDISVYTLLLVLIQQTSVALADFERTCDYQSRPHPSGYCGSNLSDMLQNLCTTVSERLLSSYVSKRSAEKALDENLRGVMLNRKEAFSYLAKREATGGITCECCFNPCTVYELLQYCQLPSAYLRPQRSDNNSPVSSTRR